LFSSSPSTGFLFPFFLKNAQNLVVFARGFAVNEEGETGEREGERGLL